MNFGYLKELFSEFATKRITLVESEATASNGHEFNSSSRLREILRTTPRETKKGQGIPTQFVYLSDDTEKCVQASGFLSWYDSRKNQAHRRPEWRLYYSDNRVIGINGLTNEGDRLVIGFKEDKSTATVFIAEEGSTAENQLKWLFGLKSENQTVFETTTVKESETINSARAQILEAAGIVLTASDDNLLGKLTEKFGSAFPTSKIFSEFVRVTIGQSDDRDPDHLLTLWMEREEFAFRVFEKHLLSSTIQTGFDSVDDFISCSLSVQNRRKSRAGLAFENHLSVILKNEDLHFERGARLENKSKPDFLFPDRNHYFDENFPIDYLTLLGAKTSCKDRWRQVLSEGARFTERHLVTLEPAISQAQLTEMMSHSLRLIIPLEIQSTYTDNQRSTLMSLAQFIEEVKTRQKKADI